MKKAFSIFTNSAGGLLLAMGLVTLVGAFQGTQRLSFPDPVLGITTKNLMAFTAVFELMVAILCFFKCFMKTQVGCVLWIGGNLSLYELALRHETGRFSAASLANWTGPLQIHAATADMAMGFAIFYLFVSGCVSGGLLWLHNANGRLVKNEIQTR